MKGGSKGLLKVKKLKSLEKKRVKPSKLAGASEDTFTEEELAFVEAKLAESTGSAKRKLPKSTSLDAKPTKQRKKPSQAIESKLEGDSSGDSTSLECQASLLGESYCKALKAQSASFLENDAFSVDTLVQLATEKPRLEQNLQISEQRLGLELCRPKKPCKHAGKGGKKGCPSVIILASSAKRALELLRELPHYGQACRVHKLFSKHMKVEEQVAALKHHLCIAVGTPNRVQKLADLEALDISRLQLMILDMQPDAKQNTLLTLPEVRDDFWSLYRAHLRVRVQAGELKFAMVGFR